MLALKGYLIPRTTDSDSLVGQPKLLYRRQFIVITDVWGDSQLKKSDSRKIYVIILNLTACTIR